MKKPIFAILAIILIIIIIGVFIFMAISTFKIEEEVEVGTKQATEVNKLIVELTNLEL